MSCRMASCVWVEGLPGLAAISMAYGSKTNDEHEWLVILDYAARKRRNAVAKLTDQSDRLFRS